MKAGVQPDSMTFSSLIATTNDGSDISVERAFGVSDTSVESMARENRHIRAVVFFLVMFCQSRGAGFVYVARERTPFCFRRGWHLVAGQYRPCWTEDGFTARCFDFGGETKTPR